MDGDGVNGSVGSEFRIGVSEFRCMTGVTKLRLSVGWHPRNGGPIIEKTEIRACVARNFTVNPSFEITITDVSSPLPPIRWIVVSTSIVWFS